MEDLRRKIGERLRELRQDRFYSLEELAHRAELNTAHLSKIERGEMNFTITTLGKVVKGLGVSWAELFSFEERKTETDPYLVKTTDCMKELTLQEREHVYRTARFLAEKTSKK